MQQCREYHLFENIVRNRYLLPSNRFFKLLIDDFNRLPALTNEDIARQMADAFAGLFCFAVDGEIVKFECCTIAGTYQCNIVVCTIVDWCIGVLHESLFAVQTQCVFNETINNRQSNEILAIVCFTFVLAIPCDQTVGCRCLEHECQQNVFFVGAVHKCRSIQFRVAVPAVLGSEFNWRMVLAIFSGEMYGAIANGILAFALADAIIFTWIMCQTAINHFCAIRTTISWPTNQVVQFDGLLNKIKT